MDGGQKWQATYARDEKGAGSVQNVVSALDHFVKAASVEQVGLVEMEAVAGVEVGGNVFQKGCLLFVRGVAHRTAHAAANEEQRKK